MSFVISPGVIQTPLTAGGVAYGTGTVAKVTSAGTAGQALISNGSGVPYWGAAGGAEGFVLQSTGPNNPPAPFNQLDSFAII